MGDREAFQKSVKAYLKTGRSSLTELACELNYTREHLSRMLHGQANMPAECVQRAVKALAALGCLRGRDQARRLLQLMDTPDFPAEDWNAKPLAELSQSMSTTLHFDWIREQQSGTSHKDLATSLNNLTSLYQQEGGYVDAESSLQRALTIYEQLLGNTHSYTATGLNNLASFYSDQGQYTKAKLLLQCALRICERILGQEHPMTGIVGKNYAIILQIIDASTKKLEEGP